MPRLPHLLACRWRNRRAGLTAAAVVWLLAGAAAASAPPLDHAAIRDSLHRTVDAAAADILLATMYPEGVPSEGTAQIDRPFPDHVAVRPPVTLLAALPTVTSGYGFRVIGRDVVLWDETACRVVDVVRNALPLPRIWPFLTHSGPELRQAIRHALGQARIDPGVLLERMEDETLDGAVPPALGEPFSWRLGNVMPPSVLRVLPALPHPIEYRFAGADLVLIDVQSGLVVGMLREALPRATREARATPRARGAIRAASRVS